MDILTQLKEIFQSVIGNEYVDDITNDTDLFSQLGMNSIGMLYMALAIEDKFGVTFSNEDFPKFRKVGDIVDFISQNKKN